MKVLGSKVGRELVNKVMRDKIRGNEDGPGGRA